MDTNYKIDSVDMQILRALSVNSRLTLKELAAKVSRSSTPVFERLRRLEATGVIKQYIAVLDAQKLDCGFVVFCHVKLKRINKDIALSFSDFIGGISKVTECYNVSGRYDYQLKVNARDMKDYQLFLLNELGTFEELESVESVFVMEELKHNYSVNI